MLRRLLEPSTCMCERSTSCGYVTSDAVAWATQEAPTCSCTPSLPSPVFLPQTPFLGCRPVHPPYPSPHPSNCPQASSATVPACQNRQRQLTSASGRAPPQRGGVPAQNRRALRGPVGGPGWEQGQEVSGAASLQGRWLNCWQVLRKPLKGPEPAICMWLRTTSCG